MPPYALPASYPRKSLASKAATSAVVALRIFTLDRCLRYEDFPLFPKAVIPGKIPRTKYSPRCSISPTCNKAFCHTSRCSTPMEGFSRFIEVSDGNNPARQNAQPTPVPASLGNTLLASRQTPASANKSAPAMTPVIGMTGAELSALTAAAMNFRAGNMPNLSTQFAMKLSASLLATNGIGVAMGAGQQNDSASLQAEQLQQLRQFQKLQQVQLLHTHPQQLSTAAQQSRTQAQPPAPPPPPPPPSEPVYLDNGEVNVNALQAYVPNPDKVVDTDWV